MEFEDYESDAPARGEYRRGINIRNLLHKRWPLMVGLFVVLAVPLGVWIWLNVPLEYTAKADLRFLASTPHILEGNNDTHWNSYEKFLNTQIQLIKGGAVLGRVLDDPEVSALPLIANSSDPLDLLQNIVKCESRRGSELVTLSCTLPDREAAKVIVDNVLAVYLQNALGEEADVGGERLRALRQERDSRQVELDDQLRRITELQRAIGLPALGGGMGNEKEVESYGEILASAEDELARLEGSAETLEKEVARLETLRAGFDKNPDEPVYEMNIEQDVASDQRIVALREELVRNDAILAQKAQRYADGSPQLSIERSNNTSLRSKVKSMERAVRKEVFDLRMATLKESLETTRREMGDVEQRKEKFAGMLDERHDQALDASRSLAELEEMKMRAEETRDLLRAVRQQINTISVESRAPARVKVAAAPRVPSEPQGGRRLQFLLLAIGASGALALSAGVFRELSDQRITSPREVALATGQPVLAAIPDGKLDDIPEGDNMATLAHNHPDTVAANEFRKILTKIAFADDEAIEIGSLLVTSPTQGDGKTLTACNLAIALAEANRHVLLIDTSPKADVETAWELDVSRGLSEVLYDGYQLTDVMRPTDFPGLYLLGPGFQSDRLGARLASHEMMELLEEAERHFDHVVIDVPPALLLADARLLAPVVDGVLVVAGAQNSTLGMVKRCVSDLQNTGASLLGIVVNGVQQAPGGYMKSNQEKVRAYFADSQKLIAELPEMEIISEEEVEVQEVFLTDTHV